MEDDGGKSPVLKNVNTCTGRMEIPTPREREALSAMKAAKERVREIKKRLDALKASKEDSGGGEIVSLEAEMAKLKETWESLEAERDAAAKERMILLGHETES